ncbi:C-type lectin domain family 10 member A-like isoform X3 [Rhinopithecus roxellana]|uniref:C-type lectin domain family 10 member A isoform X5 n=1 Tax=Rhinopithecus bieti TaxID=61621 RepID=UPI00083BF200|nr:PREDICTED: C-type lectin domain family 10 member A isoform X5 [Rhinopithecus bieti]XP_030779340.1 C-type lectin domain family 10 member A isoform X3 [Rhinopithecus roxellana]XP_030779629.1 C-type lectin domain family 10 member A-like isoform X3 [Rhinopithecus roxellana]
MTVTYENFQDLESEEKVQGVRNDSKFQRDLVTLRTDFSNFTSNTVAEIQALTSQGSSVEEMIASLKAEVEVIKQEQQAVHSEMLLRVQRLMQDLNKLTCQVATLKNNASTERTCCPINWVEHQDSCYWFSHSGMPWAEAEKHCQLEDAHLVVINSREEQNFVQEHLSFAYTWMGLSDLEGAWKWVDGTDYETGFQNWKPGQPDDWQGHGLGGGEDCAHFHPDGRWNDDVCQKPYYWVCEAGLTQASQESH